MYTDRVGGMWLIDVASKMRQGGDYYRLGYREMYIYSRLSQDKKDLLMVVSSRAGEFEPSMRIMRDKNLCSEVVWAITFGKGRIDLVLE